METILTSVQLDEKIREIEFRSPNKLLAYNEIISFCQEVLERYKNKVRKHQLNLASEIKFFKEQKQIPLVCLIYYSKLRSFKIKSPTTVQPERDYIEKKMREINSFFQSNSSFFTYVELAENYLDEYYYTRKFNSKRNLYETLDFYPDFEFSTSHDFLLAKIQAFQKFKKFLHQRLNSLDQALFYPGENKSQFRWTSSKVSLVELIYALQINGSVDNGNSDIIAITSAMERFFNIKLDNVYKTFSEIKARKGRRTKFLDELTLSLESEIERDEEL